jgi:nitrous oxide reductase accessory protein NosL
MVDANQAAYLIGSSAPGTMTMVSKIALADQAAADLFAATHGGEVVTFDTAFARATQEVEMSRAKITEKRVKSGKIKEPTETDRCKVCGMMPAKFPAHRAQILAGDDSTLHFCSTHCLVVYLAKPADYIEQPPKSKLTWVTVFPDGDFDYAGGMYYVVGSTVMGPMGPEPLPVREKAEAEAMAARVGGKVVRFHELNPAMFGGSPSMDMGKMGK